MEGEGPAPPARAPRPHPGPLQAGLTSVVGEFHLLEGAVHHGRGLEVRGGLANVRVAGGHD